MQARNCCVQARNGCVCTQVECHNTVVKFNGSHVPVETSSAECMGTLAGDTVVNLVFLFWFTEHTTVVSWLCDEAEAGWHMRLHSADLGR